MTAFAAGAGPPEKMMPTRLTESLLLLMLFLLLELVQTHMIWQNAKYDYLTQPIEKLQRSASQPKTLFTTDPFFDHTGMM
jgi:hypothetical protein